MAKGEWYVVYCDVLGVKGFLNDECNYLDLVNKLRRAYHRTIWLEEVSREINEAFKLLDPKDWTLRVRVFSDNIVFAAKCVDGVNSRILANLLAIVGAFQESLFMKDFDLLLRGAVCRGEITFGRDFVFGPALDRAFELEEKKACNPRIILDNPVADELQAYFSIDEYAVTKGFFPREYIVEDYDGFSYLNYFYRLCEGTESGIPVSRAEFYRKFVDKEWEKVLATSDDCRLIGKCNWMKSKMDVAARIDESKYPELKDVERCQTADDEWRDEEFEKFNHIEDIPVNGDRWYAAYVEIPDVSGLNGRDYRRAARALEKVYSFVEDAVKARSRDAGSFAETRCRMFAYNMFVAVKCTEGGEREALFDFLQFVSDIQHDFSEYGLKIKGGISCGKITFGDAVEDNSLDFVIGPVLVDAYLLETTAEDGAELIVDSCLIRDTEGDVKKFVADEEGWLISDKPHKGE